MSGRAAGRTVTLTPRGAVTHPATVTFAADRTVADLAPGHVRTYGHGTDVDRLALRRLDHEVWGLDLMRGERCVARLHSATWDFDPAHGPAQAAEVSGLDLEREAAPVTGAPPLAPDTLPRWLALLVVPVVLAPVVLLVLALLDGPAAVATAFAALLAVRSLALLLVRRTPRPTVLYGARPAGSVARAAHEAALVGLGERRWFATHRSARPLPPVDDEFAPASLHEVAVGARRTPRRYLQVRAADGRVLASLEPELWAADGGADELATALGLPPPGPVETVSDSPQHLPSLAPTGDIGLAVTAGVGGALAVGIGLRDGGPLAAVAVVLGGVVVLVELGGLLVAGLARRRAAAVLPAAGGRVAP